jgi:hypothetical protein
MGKTICLDRILPDVWMFTILYQGGFGKSVPPVFAEF